MIDPIPKAPAASRIAVPLQGMNARGQLEGLSFELTVEQRYVNTSERPLEAVFTFPVPLRAVLLGLQLEIGDRRLEAMAAERVQATEIYEKAIDAGDAAVLLASRGNGLWTVSVGNLKPGEAALIRYRHAELLDANRGQLRLMVPTVIAPRYGESRSALEQDAVGAPETNLLAEYPFDIRVDLAGLHDRAGITSPSHRIEVTPSARGLAVSLARDAHMDRDFVIAVRQALVPSAVQVAPDPRGSGWVGVASVVLPEEDAEHRALALKLLIDCSGSMAGDSIDAAKRAVVRALDLLDERDRLAVLRFGSQVVPVTQGLIACDDIARASLRRQLLEITADLGGTEMEAALRAAIAVNTPREAQMRDIFIVTDGEVAAIDDVVKLAASSGHRLFVVAVGAAPVEALARRLADETGGACEFVAAGELAEEAILRMFRRLRAAPRRISKVNWPVEPVWMVAPAAAVFPGETVHLIAGFSQRPHGAVLCEVTADGRAAVAVSLGVAGQAADHETLARVAAMRRLPSLAAQSEQLAIAHAVKYQLATNYTSFVVVAERSEAEKAQGLPATVKVPQMLAAGWGGAAVAAGGVTRSLPAPMFRKRAVQGSAEMSAPPRLCDAGPAGSANEAALHQPKSQAAGDAPEAHARKPTDAAAANKLLGMLAGLPRRQSLADLRGVAIDSELLDGLSSIAAKSGLSEQAVIDAFIEALIAIAGESSDGAQHIKAVWKPLHAIAGDRGLRHVRAGIRTLL